VGGGELTVNTDDREGSLAGIKAALKRAKARVPIVEK
jgi:hypothetical protein